MKNNLHERIHKIIQGVHWSPNSGIWFSDSVIDEILQTVYKEIEKKINKLEVSSIAVCGGEQGTMMMSDFIEKDEVKEVIKQIMEVEE